ncbi:ATP-dependent metallopeptidase Hfl [Tothia fuscella]|uniref:ATP-dependent metallopeptidase Hfl n=1 Tax=Tothia fuscella TaxID=1048955 RepID=A0A9P4NM13_9PEZI|nr:ATP-dependent metallopeptidase Hfl [Tothia fuscella]
MAFQATLPLQSVVTTASELWPSLSGALQTPWRNFGRPRPSPPSPSRQNHTGYSSPISNHIQSEAAGRPSLIRSLGTQSTQTPASSTLPECLATVPISSLRRQGVMQGSIAVAPTAMGIFNPVSRNGLGRCNPLTRTLPSFRMGRQYSALSQVGPFRLSAIPNGVRFGLNQQRSIWSGSNSSHSQLSHMEQTANNNPQNPVAQNTFYSALLRANRPDIVTQRYESGRFASNPGCETLYLRALERLGSVVQTGNMNSSDQPMPQNNTNMSHDQLNAVAQAVGARVRGGNAAVARAGTGAKEAPLYVVVEESFGASVFKTLKFFLWFGLAGWILFTIVTMLVESLGMLKRVGGNTHAEAKPELQKTRFSDVQGCEEAIEELQELVEFLKSPEKFSTLGGKLPKGVLLVGPPGTGKTLLARAVAGEAGVPFFYMSGSEFDEVYVGVGAKRVRELFAAARTKAPAIVFIDELDAIGGKRSERDHAYAKQTLNQLLTDLDGFDQGSGVIFLAATNFPEMLDKALVRPGRFDRHISVPLPDVRGRIAILNQHMKKMQIGTDVDTSLLARGTPGFSGAELENLANQAAVYASKRKATKITMLDLEWAKDKILMGAERRSAVIQEKDKIATAYHEGGHALVALFTPTADPLYKATIMPRGHALGITFQLPELDRVSMAKAEFLAKIDVFMGGKVAEEMIYGDDMVTSGASSDLQGATTIAYAMVTQFGMGSAKLGNVDLHSNYKNLPTETKQQIWDEVRDIMESSKKRATDLLTAKRKELDLLAKALVEYELLNKVEIESVIKGEKLEKLKPLPHVPMKAPELTGRLSIAGVPLPPDVKGPGEGPAGAPSPVPGGNEPPRPYPAA